MIFRPPRLHSITLKRAHSLLNIPRTESAGVHPSRERIQEAFRLAAKRHHPDLVKHQQSTRLFRECHDARELLLDHYVRRKYIRPEIIESTKDRYEWDENQSTFSSVWDSSSRSFQVELFLRLFACLGLAVGTHYHDRWTPERRERQVRRRDEQFAQFGPQPPRF